MRAEPPASRLWKADSPISVIHFRGQNWKLTPLPKRTQNRRKPHDLEASCPLTVAYTLRQAGSLKSANNAPHWPTQPRPERAGESTRRKVAIDLAEQLSPNGSEARNGRHRRSTCSLPQTECSALSGNLPGNAGREAVVAARRETIAKVGQPRRSSSVAVGKARPAHA